VATFNPRIFARPDRLKHIAPARLLAFLDPWKAYFTARGIDLSAVDVDDMPLDNIAHVLMNPDVTVPEDMVNALYYVDETASHDTMEQLLDRAAAAGIDIDDDTETSAADVAVQIWLAQPMLLQRQHAEAVAFARSNFMYFAGSGGAGADLPEMRDAQRILMQNRMDGWFEKKRRGRACGIFAFPRGSKIWFLVRHGLPMRREGKHLDDGEGGIAFYRPQQHDVLIYDAETDEMGVNASTKGERTLYLEVIGEVLFGDENYFNSSERFTLEPLREVGPDSLACEDIEGIARVRLVEFGRFWGGSQNDIEIRKADDLYKSFGDSWPTRLAGGKLTYAVFKVAFEGSRRERKVTVRPANIARYERDSDTDVIDVWLKARGFCRPPADEDDADNALLEVA
jgi:hypothetical protein